MLNIQQPSIRYEQKSIEIKTTGRGTMEITPLLNDYVKQVRIYTGLCHVFVKHTSASLIICENADPDVRTDLETFMGKLVPDGDPMFSHIDEGEDDMPAHVRSIITQAGLNLPVEQNELALGVWQGVYLWEQRLQPHSRKIVVTVHGQREDG